MLYLGLVFFVVLTTAAAFPGFHDPCNVMPNGPMVNTLMKDTAPKTCKNGSIWWNYPRGKLQVTFQPEDNPFSVCIWPEMGLLIKSLYQVTDQGNALLRNPTDAAHATCVSSDHGKVTVELVAPDIQTYMTLYDYQMSAILLSK